MEMESKVVTEDVVVEHVAKNLILEHVAVSGMLYVTVDQKLLYTDQFQNHVKVHIVFDDKVDEITNPQHNLDSVNDEVDEDSTNQLNWREEVCLTDSALMMKPTATSSDSLSKQRPGPTLAPEIDNQRNNRKINISSKKRTTSPLKVSVPQKKISRREMSKKLQIKPIATGSKEATVETIDSDEDCSDSQDTIDQEAQAKDDDQGTDKVLSCPYCSKSFTSQKHLSNHRKVERKQHPCSKCHRVFRYKAYLMIHIRSHHQEESAHRDKKSEQCEICGLVLSSMNNLKVHLMLHTSEFAYRCCVCAQKLRHVSAYTRHMRRHSKSGPIECKICNIRVSSRSELSKHRLTHPPHCDLCGQVFPNKTGRYFHYKTVHRNDILKCSLCNKLYSSKEALESHLKYHKNRKRTQCPFCGLFFLNLRQHIRTSHASEKSDGDPIDTAMFVCDKCPKQFKNKKAFERHLKVHSGEKLYKCPECPKQFADCGGLSRHMIIHTKERPFVCDICGKACSQRGNLRVHMQIHKADRASKSLQCSHCGVNFSQKNALQEHIDKEHHVKENVLQFPSHYFQMNTFYHGQFS